MLFDTFTKNPGVAFLCVLLAAIPIGFYLWFFLKKDREPRRVVIKTFAIGCFSVVPLSLMQYFFANNPSFNIYDMIHNNVSSAVLMWGLMYLFIGATEEYAKHLVVRIIDHKDRAFHRIVDGIEMSLIAALGFSFIEHIVYFIAIYNRGGWSELLVPFIFRATLTTLAHATFSAIYGYYYGRSRFQKDFVTKQRTVFQGLLIAMVLHGIFNTLLEFNIAWGIIPLLVLQLVFILNQLKKEGNKFMMRWR